MGLLRHVEVHPLRVRHEAIHDEASVAVVKIPMGNHFGCFTFFLDALLMHVHDFVHHLGVFVVQLQAVGSTSQPINIISKAKRLVINSAPFVGIWQD